MECLWRVNVCAKQRANFCSFQKQGRTSTQGSSVVRISTQRRARDSRSMVASTARRAPRFCTDSERNFFFGSKKCCFAQRKAGAPGWVQGIKLHLIFLCFYSPFSPYAHYWSREAASGSHLWDSCRPFLSIVRLGGVNSGSFLHVPRGKVERVSESVRLLSYGFYPDGGS